MKPTRSALTFLVAAATAVAQVEQPAPEPAKQPVPGPAKQPAATASAQNNAAAGEITPELDAAIAKGIKYIVKSMLPSYWLWETYGKPLFAQLVLASFSGRLLRSIDAQSQKTNLP